MRGIISNDAIIRNQSTDITAGQDRYGLDNDMSMMITELVINHD